MGLEQLMGEVNSRMSIFTAYSTWVEKFHNLHMEDPDYEWLFTRTQHVINEWGGGDNPPDNTQAKLVKDIAKRIFYVLSTSDQETLPLVTLVAKLDADCQSLDYDYEANMQRYSELVYSLRIVGIFTYRVSRAGHPILTPSLEVKGALREELDSKFAAALPQIGNVVGELEKDGTGLLPNIKFTGKSTKRRTPLNKYDREAISLVSRQRYLVDSNVLETMEYHVPTIDDMGIPISEESQEFARVAYNRFKDLAEESIKYHTEIQLPTTQDARGRFYNMATDPAVRLTLRSPKFEGCLTQFEYELLGE